ncbi:MAG: FeoA family protein [Bacteroidota bacterium]|nr:FeoA family protein [Bacteroidota bacterium]
MRSLAQLKSGEHAIIKSFNNDVLSNRLIEMGCLPGEVVSISKKAPLGCPLTISVANYELCLRVSEAESVLVELVA